MSFGGAKPMTVADKARRKLNEGLGKLPPHMREGVFAYVDRGREVGGFLTRLFQGDLTTALASADPVNRRAWPQWQTFLSESVPPICHGSATKHAAWMKAGGLRGIHKEDETP